MGKPRTGVPPKLDPSTLRVGIVDIQPTEEGATGILPSASTEEEKPVGVRMTAPEGATNVGVGVRHYNVVDGTIYAADDDVPALLRAGFLCVE